MPVGSVYAVTNEFTYQKNPNSYIWYLMATTVADESAIVDQLLDFGETRETAWLPLHVPSVLFECVTMREIFPGTSLPHVRATDNLGSRSCTPTGLGLPGQCSAVVTLYGDIDSPTANNRGRDFITGMCASDQVDGVLDTGAASYLEDLCGIYSGMGNILEGAGNIFSIGVFSPTRAGITVNPRVPPLDPFFYQLQHVRARSLIRTQRRRQPEGRCEETCDVSMAP